MRPEITIAIISALSAAVTALITLSIARTGARANQTVEKEKSAAELVGDLYARVESLEKQIGEMRTQMDTLGRVSRAATTFIDRIGIWLEGGMKGQRPHPPSTLAEHIDIGLWLNAKGP